MTTNQKPQSPRPARQPQQTALAKYEVPSYDDLKEQKERMGGAPPLLKLEPREQKYRLRLAPARRGLPSFVGVSSHFCEFPNKKIVSCNCPVEMKVPGMRCAVHEYLERLAKSKNPIDQQRVKDFSAKGAVYVNVLVRGTDDPKIQTWRAGWTFMKWLDGKLQDFKSDSANGNPFDPGTGGFDFSVKVEKKNGTTTYAFDTPRAWGGVALCADQVQLDEWIMGAPDLRPHGQMKPYEDVRAAILEAEGGGVAPQGVPDRGGYGSGLRAGEMLDAEVLDDPDADDTQDDVEF